MKRAASAFAALAASCTPALAHVAPWSSPDPPPLPVQFLIGIALITVAGAVILWQGAALARAALARRRERRRGLAEVGRHDGCLLLVGPHGQRRTFPPRHRHHGDPAGSIGGRGHRALPARSSRTGQCRA